LLISILLIQARPHSTRKTSQNNKEILNKADSSPHYEQSHQHTHNSDHSHHNDNDDHHKGPIEEFFSTYFPEISRSKVLMMTIAVIIISIPSLPTFLVLLSISKLNPNKPKDAPILNEKYLRWMICLAVGSLTGDVFFGMMQHIMNSPGGNHHHEVDNHHDDNEHGGHKHEFRLEIFCIIIGIFFFFMVDRIVGGHNHEHSDHEVEPINGQTDSSSHKHEQKTQTKNNQDSDVRKRGQDMKQDVKIEKKEEYHPNQQIKVKKTMDRSAILYLVADFLHNVIDGIGIGVAFTINNTLGVTTTIAIATHELPHEIGDFAILMKKNYSLGTIMITQLFTATGALFGGLLGIYFGNFAESYLLGFTAGGFLYLALGNMIPELLHSHKKATVFEAAVEATLGFMGAGLIILSS